MTHWDSLSDVISGTIGLVLSTPSDWNVAATHWQASHTLELFFPCSWSWLGRVTWGWVLVFPLFLDFILFSVNAEDS